MLCSFFYIPATGCRETPKIPRFSAYYQDVTKGMQHKIQIEPEEQTWAAIAHLSSLAGYLIPVLGIIVPIIFIFAKSESPIVSAIAKQALYLTVLCWLSAIPIFLLTITIIGIPLAWLMGITVSIVGLALPIIGAIKASDGYYFKYPIVGQNPIYYP